MDLEKAKEESRKVGYCSTSLLQRRLKLNYIDALNMVEVLEKEGFCEDIITSSSPKRKLI